MDKPYRMDEHVDPPFQVGPRALEIYRERLEVKEGVHGQYESAVLQVAHYAFNEGLSAQRDLVERQRKVIEAARVRMAREIEAAKYKGKPQWPEVMKVYSEAVKAENAALLALKDSDGQKPREFPMITDPLVEPK